MLRCVSFDVDGTLADLNFEEAIWEREVPKRYAEQYGLPFSEAYAFVQRECARLGDRHVDWYDIDYWFKQFKLKASAERMMEDVSPLIRLYPDTLPALKRLHRRFPLIAVSNASRSFLKFKLRVDGLEGYFDRVFSTTTDFRRLKSEGFGNVLRALRLQPGDLVHVGDHAHFDYETPRAAGIEAFLLDRSGQANGVHVVRSLEEFADRVLARK